MGDGDVRGMERWGPRGDEKRAWRGANRAASTSLD
jgi:hypothetical protein